MIEYIALTNFLSFKDRTLLNFKATKEKPRGALSGEDWWTEIDGSKILKIAFLLGNNGSGKTNFLNRYGIKPQEYVRNQLEEDIAADQISIKEFNDPFTGEPVVKGK